MKAIQLIKYGDAHTAFQTNEVPIPQLKSSDSVLIKVQAFGINFADVMARKGLYRAAPNLPAILGYEVVGIVERVNSNSNEYLIGKRVLAMTRFGGYAEYSVASCKGIIEIQDQVPIGHALALATQYCTAHIAIEKTSLNNNDFVLIHSASGGVGTALTQLAKLKKCQIIGLTGTSSKKSYLKNNGVDFPIYHENNNYIKKIMDVIKSQKISAIFNSVGGHTFKKDLELLDSDGHLVFFGISNRIKSRKGILNTLFQLLKIGKIHPAKLILNSQSINGLNLLEIADKKPEQIQNSLKELITLYMKNKISPMAENEFNWDQISNAHHGLENSKFVGKVYINVTKQ
jgi:NADPH2:quinone reductase|tara:strand:+ start:4047 stop:5078 length:1032 start_codon:yes stop_codon:yes gene_type:complete